MENETKGKKTLSSEESQQAKKRPMASVTNGVSGGSVKKTSKSTTQSKDAETEVPAACPLKRFNNTDVTEKGEKRKASEDGKDNGGMESTKKRAKLMKPTETGESEVAKSSSRTCADDSTARNDGAEKSCEKVEPEVPKKATTTTGKRNGSKKAALPDKVPNNESESVEPKRKSDEMTSELTPIEIEKSRPKKVKRAQTVSDLAATSGKTENEEKKKDKGVKKVAAKLVSGEQNDESGEKKAPAVKKPRTTKKSSQGAKKSSFEFVSLNEGGGDDGEDKVKASGPRKHEMSGEIESFYEVERVDTLNKNLFVKVIHLKAPQSFTVKPKNLHRINYNGYFSFADKTTRLQVYNEESMTVDRGIEIIPFYLGNDERDKSFTLTLWNRSENKQEIMAGEKIAVLVARNF